MKHKSVIALRFQSTLPAGEATFGKAISNLSLQNFNPRFPRGKRPRPLTNVSHSSNFNPRFPRGKRHGQAYVKHLTDLISIHASRGGSDRWKPQGFRPLPLFQSTLPAGEATVHFLDCVLNMIFQSTLPAGEATSDIAADVGNLTISIHASRGGSDSSVTSGSFSRLEFQSTLPAGEAT